MNSAMPDTKTATNELYASLPAEVCLVLEKHERHITVPRGQKLVQYGVLPEQLLILNSGTVEISVPGPETDVSLGTAGPGKVFGMRALVSGETPEIDVTPLENCDITVIPGPEFLAALQTTPQLYFGVAKVLSADLKIADQLIRNCSRKNFAARKV